MATKSDFDWRTEEEVSWDDASLVKPNEPAAPRPRRWPFYVVALFVLILGTAVVYRQVLRRAEAAEAAVKEDVLSSENLVRYAAAQEDLELFTSLLSGRDPRWTQAQKDLFAEGSLYDRSPLGLHVQNETTEADESDVVDITLSSELTEAELQLAQSFTIDAGNGVSETVILERTAVYRLSRHRWLLSPPLPEFWGEIQSHAGQYVQATYLERDAELAGRLAADLDAKVSEMCATLADLHCPDGLKVSVRFSSDPAVLVALDDSETRLTAGVEIEVPTPTLVGRPVDEAGYRALFRGYAVQVLSPLISELVGWECCNDRTAFFEALLARQMSRLALQPWPLDAADYEQLVSQAAQLDDATRFWTADFTEETRVEARPLVLAVVDFLLEASPERSLAAMQQRLKQRLNYWEWLEQSAGRGLYFGDELPTREAMAREWLRFIDGRTLSARRPLPVPLPEQSLYLLCRGPDVNSTSVYRYDMADETWATELLNHNILLMTATPDDSHLVLEEVIPANAGGFNEKAIILRQDGRETVAYQGPERTGIVSFFAWGDSTGRHLMLYTFGSDTEPPTFLSLDLESCNQSGCDIQELDGFPIWSPDGVRAILWRDEGLVLADADGNQGEVLTPSDTAFAPFWLDAETYGFIVEETDGSSVQGQPWRQEIRVGSIHEPQAQAALTLEELRALLPDDEQSRELSIYYVSVHPAQPNQLVIAAWGATRTDGHLYLFAFDWNGDSSASAVAPEPPSTPAGERLSLLMTTGNNAESYPPFHFSPGGRYIVIPTANPSGSERQLVLVDLIDGRMATLPAGGPNLHYDWSADGQWLFVGNEGFLHLYAPEHGYQRLLVHDFADCFSAVWAK